MAVRRVCDSPIAGNGRATTPFEPLTLVLALSCVPAGRALVGRMVETPPDGGGGGNGEWPRVAVIAGSEAASSSESAARNMLGTLSVSLSGGSRAAKSGLAGVRGRPAESSRETGSGFIETHSYKDHDSCVCIARALDTNTIIQISHQK